MLTVTDNDSSDQINAEENEPPRSADTPDMTEPDPNPWMSKPINRTLNLCQTFLSCPASIQVVIPGNRHTASRHHMCGLKWLIHPPVIKNTETQDTKQSENATPGKLNTETVWPPKMEKDQEIQVWCMRFCDHESI